MSRYIATLGADWVNPEPEVEVGDTIAEAKRAAYRECVGLYKKGSLTGKTVCIIDTETMEIVAEGIVGECDWLKPKTWELDGEQPF